MPVALTIAGSDSGGGAGIQADLKTLTALGVWGTCAITCVTAQNLDEVAGIQPIYPEMVSLQIKMVCDGFDATTAKTGMLFSCEIIEAVARAIEDHSISTLVVDPVMVATSGAQLLKEDAIEALCKFIIPKATVITPNVPELEILAKQEIKSVEDLKAAAKDVGDKYNVACVAKGGHLENDKEIIDILYHDGKTTEFSALRVESKNTHGTGCRFSAALTALLTLQKSLPEAVKGAKEFVAQDLKKA